MAITINGSGITSANIADGAIVNADVSDLAASKLTGALPAISGASLTSLTSSQVDSGSTTAKAWVNFNGQGTVAIRASYNVSSITDNGTGDYIVNFTTAMADADYSTVSGGQSNANSAGRNYIGSTQIVSTTAVRIRCVAGDSYFYDYYQIFNQVFGA
tara:strand:- start:125 stop:598 length:474 start_codon:yes stop_codon:yes gene_type:complete